MGVKRLLTGGDETARKDRLRSTYNDHETCPNCSEPIGGMWHWNETLANESVGVVVGYEDCPYCQTPLLLTVKNDVHIDEAAKEVTEE